MTLPPLPPPDTHCWDEDTSKDVWSYSDDAMRAYAEQAVAAERERCAKLCDEVQQQYSDASSGDDATRSCAAVIRQEKP